MSRAQHPQPSWSMKWILVAIIVVIVPYTYLRWHYRKPGRAFEPYQDIKDRANTMRLLSAGFQRITLDANRPADGRLSAGGNLALPGPGGLPDALATTLVNQPLLPAEILAVTAAPSASAMLAYPIEVTCTVPDNHQQLAGAELYVRGGEIFITPHFERLSGSLLARTRENVIRLTVPPGTLKPGHYRVMLLGARASKAWTLDVR